MLASTLEMGQKELAKTVSYQLTVLEREMRVLLAKPFEQTLRQGEVPDICFTPQ